MLKKLDPEMQRRTKMCKSVPCRRILLSCCPSIECQETTWSRSAAKPGKAHLKMTSLPNMTNSSATRVSTLWLTTERGKKQKK